MRRLGTLVLTITLLMSACSKDAEMPSAQERLLAQKVLNLGEMPTDDEIAAITTPSPLFPYLVGQIALVNDDLERAHEAFMKLAESFPRSTIVSYYVALTQYGLQHPAPLPEMIHAFAEELSQDHDISYVARGGERQNYSEDPFIIQLRKYYALSPEEREDLWHVDDDANRWFSSLSMKQPFDYIIYSALAKLPEKEQWKVLQEGLEKYPDNRALLIASTSMGMRSDDAEIRAASEKMLPMLDDALSYALLEAALSCQNEDREEVEAWELFAPPLCPAEIEHLKGIASSPLGSVDTAYRTAVLEYYNQHVAEHIPLGERMLMTALHGLASPIDLYVLSHRVLASASQALEKGNAPEALSLLRWNRLIFKALGEPGVLLTRMLQLMIAERTWTAEIEAYKQMPTPDRATVQKLETNLRRLKELLWFSGTYVTQGPLLDASPLLFLPYQHFEATRPLWVDEVF